MGREVKKSIWKWMILSLLLSLTIIVTSPPSWAEGEDDDLPFALEAVPSHMVSSRMPSHLRPPQLQSKSGGLEAFNLSQGTANNAWKALWDKKTGHLKVLYGSKSKAYPGSPKEASMAFLKENEGFIGLEGKNLEFVRERKTNLKNHTRFKQVFNGIPVEGRYVAVHSTPQGEVTMVQNGFLPDLKVENVDSFPLDLAVLIAQNDLMASLPSVTIKTTGHQEKIVRNKDQYLYVWEVTFYTVNPFGEWVYRIDAQTGVILSKWDALLYATGKGYVYKSNNDYWAGKVSSVSLKYLFPYSEGNDEFLTGYYADPYDYYGENVYAPNLKFLFLDQDSFDQVQAYYHVTTFHDWWDKTFVGPYGLGVIPYFNDSDSSTPLMINVPPSWNDMGDNAFYTPSFDNYFDAGRPGPGIVFGDQFTRQDGTYAEDKTEDQDVVYHEFTHGMMDWLGHEANFSGTPHHYERSMGEGNSDYWASSYTKSPDWADVMGGSWERPLDNTWVYPWYVGCAGNFNGGGITEEHCTGRIWGGFLWDIKALLKNSADKYIFESLDYFDPDGGHVPNEGDFGDAAWAMLMAEADLHGNLNNSMKIYGAAVSRGIFSLDYYSHPSNYLRTGNGGTDWQNIAYWNFDRPGKIATSGNVLNEKDDHFYFFQIFDSLWVDVSINSSFIVPFCTVRQVLGDYDSGYDVSGSLSEVYSETSTTTKLRTDYLDPGLYVVWLNGDFDTTGSYKITINIKR